MELTQNMKSEMKVKPTESWHKPKNGSIFPAKRRSVKRMMWDSIVGPKAESDMGSPPSKSNKNNSLMKDWKNDVVFLQSTKKDRLRFPPLFPAVYNVLAHRGR
ncbi:hypothetical protein CR513_60539, partial [Mucuna pruriens]